MKHCSNAATDHRKHLLPGTSPALSNRTCKLPRSGRCVDCCVDALLRPAEEPTLRCAFPLRHQRSMCALAIPLEICNGFKLLRKSDIFIVRGWDSGQPLTIIRGIFLRDVYAQMVNLYGIVFSFSFPGALKRKPDTCMTCPS